MNFNKIKSKINLKSLRGFYKNFKIDNIKKSSVQKFKLKEIKKIKKYIKSSFFKQNKKSLKNDKARKVLKNKKRAYFKQLLDSAIEGSSIINVPRKINQLKNKVNIKFILKNGFNNKLKILFNKELFLNLDYLKDFRSKIKNKISKKSKILSNINYKNNLSLPPQINVILNKYFPKKKDTLEKLSDDSFLVIHFSDHILTIAKISINKSINSIEQLLNINIPTDIIGDFKVENKIELSNILQDVISLYETKTIPIILLLSSTFFTIKSFNDGELVVFSENNPELLSKSPFLPDNTLMQHTRVSGTKLSSYHRVVYINKNVLDSWIEVLSKLENPIGGVTSSCIHLVEQITSKEGGLTILCDIELNATVIYLEKSNCEFNSVKLPFGASIYISEDENIGQQFLVRLDSAINKILEKYNYKSPESIYLIGQGFDKLNTSSISKFDKFKQFPIEIFNKYKLNKDIDKETIQNNISNIIKLTSIAQIANK